MSGSAHPFPLHPDAPDPRALDRLAAAVADRLAGAVETAVEEAVRGHLYQPQEAPPLLDLKGAAARLAVSERTVETLVALGELPVIRIGAGRGVRRFEPAALDALIRRRARQF